MLAAKLSDQKPSRGPLWLGLGTIAGVGVGAVGSIAYLERDWRGVATASGIIFVLIVGEVAWWWLSR